MKAFLNHAFLIGHKEFMPVYEGNKGGNVIHQIDSVYYFSNEDSRLRMAISIAVDKGEQKIEDLFEVNILGTMNGEKILKYNKFVSDIASKDEFDDIKIFKWTDYIEFSFNRNGLVIFDFNFKTKNNDRIKVIGNSSSYFVLGESPIKEKKSTLDKIKSIIKK